MDNRNNFGERRRQADWVVNAAAILSLISWIVSISVLFLIDIASPDALQGLTTALGGTPDTAWNVALLPAAFFLLVASVFACITAFIFNMLRMRRKTDKVRKSIIIIGVSTIVGIIFFVLRFGGYIFF